MRRGRSSRENIPVIALLAWAALATSAMATPRKPGNSIKTPAVEIQQRHFHGDDDEDEAQGPHFHSEEEMGGHAERAKEPDMWLTKGDITKEYLLEVQALIVKDEQVTDDCKPSNTDLRKSNWRHFMCYGSILSNTFILTSSSCLHEALYIRHNIQATLAAVVGPVSESIQVIKITQYIIHPKIDVDPRHTRDHIRHDLAVAKLSCKISKKNFFPIELPTKPLREMCKDDNCYVTVIKRREDHTNLIFEYIARDIEYHKLTIRQADIEDKKIDDSAKQPIKVTDNLKGTKNMNEEVKRQMCTKTGSAVMANKIQAGLVAMSCDVRQPETPWLYTDLFDNVEWIVSVADLEMPKSFSNDNTEFQKPSEKCSTCVYNFYFDWKQKDMCPNKLINDLGGNLTPCKSNSAEPESNQKSSNFIAAYPKDDYLRALDVMYRDQFKHNHQGVPIAPKSDKASIDDQMIPVTNDFEVSKKSDSNNKDENQNVDIIKSKENTPLISTVNNSDDSEFTKSSNKMVDKVASKKNSDVPEEYKNLYQQYLREFQLKNS